MEREQLIGGIENIKNNLSKFLNIDKSSINISEPIYDSSGFKVEIEILFKFPSNYLRTFNLETYSFSINHIDEEGFVFENQYYSFSNIESFSKEVSDEIQNM